jgi:hypothetical protein
MKSAILSDWGIKGYLTGEVKKLDIGLQCQTRGCVGRKTAGRQDLRDKARAILLWCAKHLTFHADMGGMQRTDRNKQDAGLLPCALPD